MALLPPTQSALSTSKVPPPQQRCAVMLNRRRLALMSSVTLLKMLYPKFVLAVDLEDEDELRTVELFEAAIPSVISIQKLEFPKEGEEAEIQGMASGFVWDRFGHIVTNYHVVARSSTDQRGRRQTKVLGLKGTNGSYDAQIIGADPSRDLAVLKIDVSESGVMNPALIGSSRDLKVGQSCYAIGNPYGFEHTLSSGVVSGLNRQIPSPFGKPILGAIQTDASINEGNSGGPLIDSFGRVIGVNTTTPSQQDSGTSSGVNFAIGIDLVREIVPKLIIEGRVSTSREIERKVLDLNFKYI